MNSQGQMNGQVCGAGKYPEDLESKCGTTSVQEDTAARGRVRCASGELHQHSLGHLRIGHETRSSEIITWSCLCVVACFHIQILHPLWATEKLTLVNVGHSPGSLHWHLLEPASKLRTPDMSLTCRKRTVNVRSCRRMMTLALTALTRLAK